MAPGHRSGEPAFRRLTLALFLAGLATFTTLYCPQALLPQLSSRFHVGAAAATLSVSVATFGLALGMLVAGPLSDVVGRTPLMRRSLVAASIVQLLTAVAPSWHLLLVLRGLQGLTLAGLPAVTMAYLREEVHPSSHARATGLYIAGNAIGGMTGRLVAGAVGDLWGWRAGLAAIGALALGSAIAVLALLPESERFHAARASSAAVLASARDAVRDPVLLGLYAVGAVLMGSFVALYNVIGFRLHGSPYHLGAAAGLVYLVYPLGSLASTTAGRAADRFGRRAVAPCATLVAVVGALLTLASPLPVLVGGIAVLTCGFFAAHSLASGWVATRAHLGGGGAGQASALYLLAYYVGGSVFGSLAGVAWSRCGWGLVTLLTGGLGAVATVVTLALRRTEPRQAASVVPAGPGMAQPALT